MDNIQFYNSFSFQQFILKKHRHNDNSRGIDFHFIGRMRSGSGEIETESGLRFSLSASDIFYLPIGLRYHSFWTPDRTGNQTVTWDSFGFGFFPCRSGQRYEPQILHPSETALRFLDAIDLSAGVSTSSIGLLYAFLGEVFPTMQKTDSDREHELLSKARNFIYAHPQFKVSDLARHCGMSESGLYAFFRSYAGTTPIEEKNRILVGQAITLLTSTDLSVEEIAARLGIQSTAYLRKIIHAQTQKTPSELRKMGLFEGRP